MKTAGWVVKWIAMCLLAAALLGGATMVLWNWLVPPLFSGPPISFWQALGLLALAKVLFFNVGRGGGPQGHACGNRWKKKWEQLPPEQREQLKARMKACWCAGEHPDAKTGNATD